jgi:hypothetical protein
MTAPYTPEPNASSGQELSLIDMLNTLEKDVTSSETASEKFKKTCDKIGFYTEDNF